MNHLIKNIKFYKDLKENDIKAISNLFDFDNIKKIYYKDFIFIKTNQINQSNCSYCLENIYTDKIPYISIQLGNRYFYLNKAKYQIFEKEINIIDLIHFSNTNLMIDSFVIIDFFTYFPSFTLIINESIHNHLIASIMEAPILNKDATFMFNSTYKLNWYLNTFLITNNEFSEVLEDYQRLLNKYNIQKHNIIINKKNKKYYLYLIVIPNEDISIYEACGVIVTSDLKINFDEIILKIKNKTGLSLS